MALVFSSSSSLLVCSRGCSVSGGLWSTSSLGWTAAGACGSATVAVLFSRLLSVCSGGTASGLAAIHVALWPAVAACEERDAVGEQLRHELVDIPVLDADVIVHVAVVMVVIDERNIAAQPLKIPLVSGERARSPVMSVVHKM